MAGDNELQVIVRAVINELSANMQEAQKIVVASSEQMNAAVAQATAGMSTEIEKLTARVKQLEDEMANGVGRASHQMRAEMALISDASRQTFGVSIPRHLRGFIAELPGVGVALEAAFSATAVLFLISIVVEVGKKIAELIDNIDKLSASEKKHFDDLQKQSKDTLDMLAKNLKAEYEIQIAKATGVEKDRLRLQMATALVRIGQQTVENLKEQQAEARDIAKQYEAMADSHNEIAKNAVGSQGGGAAALANLALGKIDEGKSAAFTNQAREMQKAITDADISLKELQGTAAGAGRELTHAMTESANKTNDLRIRLIAALGDMPQKDANELRERILKIADPEARERIVKFYEAIRKDHDEVKNTVTKNTAEMQKRQDELTKSTLEGQQKILAEAIKDADARAKTDHQIVQSALASIDQDITATQGATERKKMILDDELAHGEITQRKYLQSMKKALDDEYKATATALQEKLRLLSFDPTMNPEEYDRIQSEIAKLREKHNADMLKNTIQMRDAQMKVWRQLGDGILSTMRGSVQGIIMGTTTIGEAVRNLMANTLATVAEMLIEMGLKWIGTHLMMRAISSIFHIQEVADTTAAQAAKQTVMSTTNSAGVISDAALAAANAYAAFAAFPPVAAAMAAEASATVLGFLPMAMFHGGGDVPYDMPAFLQKDEMVLDRNHAQHVRDTAAGGSGSSSGKGPSFHYAPSVQALDATGVDAVLSKHERVFTKHVKRQLKQLGFKTA